MSHRSLGVVGCLAVFLAIGVSGCASNGGSNPSSSPEAQIAKINAEAGLRRTV